MGRHQDDGKDFAHQALQLLRSARLRVTRQRRELIALLGETCDPLNPYELKDRMDARGIAIDTVSIYRILACFESRGIVHRIPSSGGYVKCHLSPGDDACHHYLVCRHCRRVEEMPCGGLEPWEEEAARRRGFQVETHNIELSGICSSCREALSSRNA
ncbi:MAG: transcriptional repressor [Myxococcales bacterium]|nr:transcriptional repressor [Myxococcales bacterium]